MFLYYNAHYFRMSKDYLDLNGHAGKRSTAVLASASFAGLGELGTQGLENIVSYTSQNAPPGSGVIFVLGCICAAYISGDRIYKHIKNGSYWLQEYLSRK